MKPTRRYLGLIERIDLKWLLISLVMGYLVLAFGFALLYYAGNLIDSASIPLTFRSAFYFSFVTQSTIGYGDITPKGWGIVGVVLQTSIGMVYFALGTGAIVLRMLTPSRHSIAFDDHLIFYPHSGQERFRFRLVNRLPITLSMAHIEMRLRYRRLASGQWKWSRRAVELLRPTITVLNPLSPLLVSTLEIEEQVPLDKIPFGQSIRLQPSYLEEGREVTVTFTAQHFTGTYQTGKTFSYDKIHCGEFASTTEDAEPVYWENWNRFWSTNPSECPKCPFFEGCPLKLKLVVQQSKETSESESVEA